jgi:carbonic anhydrase
MNNKRTPEGTATVTRMTPLLERNEQFARTHTPSALGLPAAGLIIVTCLDHRVDPAIVLGLRLGDALVLRNAGGRVTQAVIDDIVYLGFLTERMRGGGQDTPAVSLEVAIIHHTQCGTGRLAEPGFRHQAAAATGLSEDTLAASAVTDPHTTVTADVERLLAASALGPEVSVSGHVYNVTTGRVTTVLDARRPSVAA